jgi:preprotein translocase subunit SecG
MALGGGLATLKAQTKKKNLLASRGGRTTHAGLGRLLWVANYLFFIIIIFIFYYFLNIN